MGEYADIKRRNIKKLLKWLTKKESIVIVKGGNHTVNIKYAFWSRPFPIPFKHGVVNKYIVKDLMEALVKEKICTKEEFDRIIK